MIRSRFSSLLGFVVTAIVAVPSAAFVMQRTLADEPRHRMELTSSRGALTITNSREGQAILTAAPMIPGTSTSGVVVLENTGDSREALTLDAGAPADTPGPGGGRLSERLRLRVDATDDGGATTTVYSGSLTGLHLADLGTLEKGESRSYRFVVSFPDGGAHGADNAYQGSSASIAFDWTIAGAGPATPPADAPLEQQIAADEPLAYWPLDDSESAMADIAGGHQGTYANTVTIAEGTAPGGGRAAWFDGTAGYGYANGIAAPGSAYTMEAWVNPATSADMVIVEHGAGGALSIENGRFVFRHLGNRVGSAAAAAGRWQQVVGTWDAMNGEGRLYVDGALAAEAGVPGRPSGSATFYVGRGSTGSNHFHGAMAQVSYYRSSLDADRIHAHWTVGKVEAVTTPSTPTPQPPAPSGDPGSAPTADAQAATPSTSCPGAVVTQGGGSSMWSILSARARAKAAARAKALAKAKARARGKGAGKARNKARQKARAAKKSKRSACARTKQTSRSG